MTILRFSKVLLLITLIGAFAGLPASANCVMDSLERTWCSSVANYDGSFHVRIEISDAGGSIATYWATLDSDGDNNIEPFLYCLNDQVWMVWSCERTAAGTFDICQRQLALNQGELGIIKHVTRAAGSPEYSDRRPCGAICPLGHHVVFQRETPTSSGTYSVISYLNNIPTTENPSGSWSLATMEEIELEGGRSGTEPLLLVGNFLNGAPVICIFKEWYTY